MRMTKKIVASGLSVLMVVNSIFVSEPSVSAEAAENSGTDLEDGLVGYYSFDGTLENAVGTGSAALHGGAGDTWNTAATGTAAYASGKNGKAYSFTGDADGIKGEGLELDVKMPSEYTISYWVNPDTVNSATSMVFVPIDLDNGLNIADNWFGSTFPTVRIWGSSAATADSYMDNWVSSADALCGQWTYVTLTGDASGNNVLYINGEQAATGSSIAGAFEGKDIFLGINFWDASFDGLMDDVAVYNRALSAEQVAELYTNNGVPGGSDVVVPQHVSVHDPSIVKDESTGMYYIFGSHMAWAKSSDLIHWETFTNNINTDYKTLFAKEESWASHGSSSYDISGNLWAPDVIYNEQMGKWCMYMSVNGDNWYTSIALLTADSLDGDWTYEGTVVYSGFTNSSEAAETDYAQVIGSNDVAARYLENRNGNRTYGMNAIDPCVLYDDDGNLWMSYGSWFGGIYMLKLDNSTGLRDYTYTYETIANESDAYQGLKLAGGQHVSGEASYIQKIGDYYYLFMSYGGLVATGGYNMRVFRSTDIEGPYVDYSGDDARYTSASSNINGTIGNRLMSGYQWSYMSTGNVAQGHNSAFVDEDGKAYVVYHTRFNDGTEGHQVRVHQLFVNEDGWLVTAPFEYTGETLTDEVTAEDVTGAYEVLFHKLDIDYADLEVVTGENLSFNADGTVTGDRTGTWKFSDKGAPYVTITLGSTTYKGVFVQQQMEDSSDTTWCFTLLGSDEISVWGYKYVGDGGELAEKAAENLSMPQGTFENLTLPDKGINTASITWSSSNEAVLASDGTVTTPDQDTVVTLTATFTVQGVSVTKDYPITVYSPQSDTENKVLAKYFTNQKVDLSSAVKGTYQYANPFFEGTTKGLEMYNGVSIKFDVEAVSGADQYLRDIITFNAGTGGGLFFEGNSYLGYNGTGGIFDANLKNGTFTPAWQAGTDFLGTSASVEIRILPTGFEVYVNDSLVYNQDSIEPYESGKTDYEVPGQISIDSYASVLGYLQKTASYLNFGWGSFWDGGYNGTISNVVLSALPVEVTDTSAYLYYENFNRLAGKTGNDTGWISANASNKLSVITSYDEHGYYLSYDNPADSGNRGAYTLFPEEANVNTDFMVEADVMLNSGGDRNTVFAITDDTHTSNNGNNDISTGYFLKLTVSSGTTTCTVAGTDYTFTLPKNTWIHVSVSVDEDGNVVARIGDQELTGTSTAAGALGGMFLLNGRSGSYSAIDNIAVHAHNWDEGNITKEPACTEEGERTYTCSVCGETKTEVIEASGHEWDEGTVTKEPTCTEEGIRTYTCNLCSETRTEEIEASGHTAGETVIENKVEAGCETEGSYDEVVYCSICKAELSRETKTIAALEHEWDEGTVTKEPTCTEEGIRTYTCNLCSETRTEEIEASGHTAGETVIENKVEAGCETEGSYDEVVYCSVCKAELGRETKTIAALGHEWDEGTVTKEPTCTEEGEKTYICNHCGEIRTEAVAALGHISNDGGTVTKEPTCTETGIRDYTCLRCGEGVIEDIPALGHDWDEGTVIKEPTCTEEGEKTYTCNRCDETRTEAIEILGHDWDEGTVTKEPTCTGEGEKTYTCNRCDETRTEAIEALGHTAGNAVKENEIAAGCESEGSYDEVVYCSVCGEELSRESKTVEALGHDWDEGKVTKEPTCTEAGEKTYTCSHFGETRTEVIEALGHTAGNMVKENEIAAGCESEGSYDEVVYCSVCGGELSRESKTVEALGHDWDEGKVTKEPTCTEAGEKTYTCSHFGETRTEAIEALGHTAGNMVKENEIAAGCENEGSYDEVVYCSVCGEELSRESKTVEALGHDWDEGKVTKEPTCTEEGVKTYTCGNCNETKIEAIPVTAHSYGTPEFIWNSDDSVTAAFTCTVCGNTYTVEAEVTGKTENGVTIYTAAVKGINGETYTATKKVVAVDTDTESDLRIVVSEGMEEIPENLVEAGLDSNEKIVDALLEKIIVEEGYSAENSIAYDIVLQISKNEGKNWETVTAENFPKEGITLMIPYPGGTNGKDYDFMVTHMFTVAMNGYQPGDVEVLSVIKTEAGLQFHVTSLSPIAVSWVKLNNDEETPDTDIPGKSDDTQLPGNNDNTGNGNAEPTEPSKPSDNANTISPVTADSSEMSVWILICGVVSFGFVVAAMSSNRKQKKVK